MPKAGTIVPMEAANISPVLPLPPPFFESPNPSSLASAAIIGTKTATLPDAEGTIKAKAVPIQKTP